MRGVTNRNQCVSINGFNSTLIDTICGTPQDYVLGPLLFLSYKNDLHCAIKSCKVHNFSDIKNLSHWVNANKIALTGSKTELVIFSPRKKQLDRELKTTKKIRLNCKKLYQTDSVKYLGIHLYKYLIWKFHVNNVALKLNKANAMLTKIKHYVDIKL